MLNELKFMPNNSAALAEISFSANIPAINPNADFICEGVGPGAVPGDPCAELG